jgi:hypothetical protein
MNCRVSGSAHQGGAGPSVGGMQTRACPLRQLREAAEGASVSTVCVECRASSSEAVTAVTTYASSTPLFFGRRISNALPRVAVWELLDGYNYYQGGSISAACARLPFLGPEPPAWGEPLWDDTNGRGMGPSSRPARARIEECGRRDQAKN